MERKFELPDAESIIKCPICSQLLCPPVLQCAKGHIVCAECRKKQKRNGGCPSCRSVTFSRNLAVEHLLHSLLTTCRYSPQGCQEMLKLGNQKDHHETHLCAYRPLQEQQNNDDDPMPWADVDVAPHTREELENLSPRQRRGQRELDQQMVRQRRRWQRRQLERRVREEEERGTQERNERCPVSLEVLMPLMQVHLTPDQAFTLAQWRQRVERNDITKDDFFWGARGFIGDEILLLIIELLASQLRNKITSKETDGVGDQVQALLHTLQLIMHQIQQEVARSHEADNHEQSGDSSSADGMQA